MESKCRFLRDDGTCAFSSDDEVREFCVAGPCSVEVDEDGSMPGANLHELAERVQEGYLYGE